MRSPPSRTASLLAFPSRNLRSKSRPSRPPPVSDPEADARRDYRRAEDIGTHKAWSDFLDKHPTGHYAILAQDKLAKLETPTEPAKPEPEPKIVLGRSGDSRA